MNRILIMVVALTSAVFTGCNSSEPGGKIGKQTPSSQTFTVKAPTLATTIKQGDKHTLKLTLDRGKDFKEAVTLKAEPPTGLSVNLEPKKVKPGDSETVTATVSVGKEAALGDHKIKVTATPETGSGTEVEFKVKVEKKAD